MKTYYEQLVENEQKFEQTLMDKYPELFEKNEDGSLKPSSCGIGCPEEWREIVDNLCGCIVEYTKTAYRCDITKNKKLLFKYWLYSNLWYPIHKIVRDIIDPYRGYRPKDRTIWTIKAEVQKAVEQTRRYAWMKKLDHLTYRKLCPSIYESKPQCPKVIIGQVKSKFNELRFYADGTDKNVRGMIDFAEYLCKQASKKKKAELEEIEALKKEANKAWKNYGTKL